MNLLQELIFIEEKLKYYYHYLAKLEVNNALTTFNYATVKQIICELSKKETQLLNHSTISYQELKKQLEKSNFHYRLIYIIDSIYGDEGIEYANALNYDIHKIMIKFIQYMINNPYYNEIKEDLIYFKYDIIYFDYQIEQDFILETYHDKICLDSKNYKIPSSIYIDRAILIGETKDMINILWQFNEQNNIDESLVFVLAIHILARMSLCSASLIPFIINDFNQLLEEANTKIKELLLEAIEILKQIEASFYFSR